MANLWDLFVRVMGNSGQFREDILQDKAVLDDFLNSIHDLDINVDVDDADAAEKLEAFKAELDRIRNAHADIDIDDAAAKEKIDQIKVKLDDLRNASARINIDDADAKAKIDDLKLKLDEIKNASAEIKVDDFEAKAKLDEVKARIDELNDKVVDINIDDADAKAKVDDIKAKLESIRNAHSNIDIDDAEALAQLEALDLKLDGVAARIKAINRMRVNPSAGDSNDESGKWKWLSGSILTLLPAITPLITTLTSEAGSMASSFGAATAGVAGFAVVEKSGIDEVTTAHNNLQAAQMRVVTAQKQVSNAKTYQEWLVATENLKAAQQNLLQVQSQLTTQQREGVAALQQWDSFWGTYTKSFDSQTIRVYVSFLRMLEDLLTDMKPVISAAASALEELLKEMDEGLKSSSTKEFFEELAHDTGPAILAWGRAAGNIIQGLMGIFMAFSPTLGHFNKGLDDTTASFARWGQGLRNSQGFKEFLDYARQEGPQVITLLKNLGTTFMDLLKAMAPAGAITLQVVNGILQLINALLGVNPIVGQVGVAIMQGIGVMRLLSPVISVVVTAIKWFATAFLGASEEAGVAILGLSGPIGWIVAAVVAAVTLIVTHWKQVSAAAVTVWHDIENAFNALAKFLGNVWHTITQAATTAWNAIVAFFQKWGADILIALTGPIGIMVIEIAKHWDEIVSGVQDLANRFIQRFNQIVDFLKNLPSQALQWGENMMHMLAQGIENGISWVEDKVKSVAQSIKNFLGFSSPTKDGPGSTADRWMPNLMNMMVDGINAGIPKVHAALNQVIVPPNSAAMMTAGGAYGASAIAAASIHAPVHIYGNVYSTDDINAAVKKGVQDGISTFTRRVKTTARAMGVSS